MLTFFDACLQKRGKENVKNRRSFKLKLRVWEADFLTFAFPVFRKNRVGIMKIFWKIVQERGWFLILKR